uniref:Uncharacterized protein n=1 Tax=Avena sativa TaxID=4498 RepID=A0ACD5UWB7_AVESA
MASSSLGRQEWVAPAWFVSLAILGALYIAPSLVRLLNHLALCFHQPMDLGRRYGAWAVVTGPTSGIGRSMTLELARRGLNLVLVGHNAANVEEISETIGSRYGVQTKTVLFDLSLVSTPKGDEAMGRLRDVVGGLDVGVLVNNAGVVELGARYLHEADVEAWMGMVRVNLWAVTELTAAVLPGMLKRGRGAVVNMGSASSEAIPSFPLYTMYAATKRYVAHFSNSLYVEYKRKGIHVQCQAEQIGDITSEGSGLWPPLSKQLGRPAPLYVRTRMLSRLADKSSLYALLIALTPDTYARAAVRWIGHGPPLCVPNIPHQLLWCVAAVVPDQLHDWLRLREHRRHREMCPTLAEERFVS